MIALDFNYINHFTQDELEQSGADVSTISYDLIHNLDKLRTLAKRPVFIMFNGLNSGDHIAVGHRNGVAVDVHIGNIEDRFAVKLVMMASVCGFNTVGVYKNPKDLYSFHFEISKTIRCWAGNKKNMDDYWDYSALTFNI